MADEKVKPPFGLFSSRLTARGVGFRSIATNIAKLNKPPTVSVHLSFLQAMCCDASSMLTPRLLLLSPDEP